jgi:PAS domain S-box-containing protein
MTSGFSGPRAPSTDQPLPAAGALFSALVGVDLAVALLDLEGKVQLWNPAAETMTGWNAREVIGQPLPWVPSNRRSELHEMIEGIRGGETFHAEALEGVRNDGASVPLRVWAVPILDPNGAMTHALAIAEDLSAIKRVHEMELFGMLHELRTANEERRRLLGRLIHVQEEARRRIAADVHDDTIQKIVAAGMRVEMLKRTHPELADDQQLAAAGESIAAAVARLRHMVFELRPAILDTSGLAAAIRWYVEEHESIGLDAELRVVSKLRNEPSEELRIVLFRVAQEARKHARASRIEVFLDEREGGVYLRVSDDGVGFDPASLGDPAPGHMGLVEARERIELADGRWSVSSATGSGTTVEAWLPSSIGRPSAEGPGAPSRPF